MMTRFVVLFVAMSCSRPTQESTQQEGLHAKPPELATTDTLDSLRESARETLDANCAECHTRGFPTALPRALRIFDLTEPDWSRHMSEAQLREAARRLGEPFGPTRGEGEIRPIHVSEGERSRFTRFVDVEIARRQRSLAQ